MKCRKLIYNTRTNIKILTLHQTFAFVCHVSAHVINRGIKTLTFPKLFWHSHETSHSGTHWSATSKQQTPVAKPSFQAGCFLPTVTKKQSYLITFMTPPRASPKQSYNQGENILPPFPHLPNKANEPPLVHAETSEGPFQIDYVWLDQYWPPISQFTEKGREWQMCSYYQYSKHTKYETHSVFFLYVQSGQRILTNWCSMVQIS